MHQHYTTQAGGPFQSAFVDKRLMGVETDQTGLRIDSNDGFSRMILEYQMKVTCSIIICMGLRTLAVVGHAYRRLPSHPGLTGCSLQGAFVDKRLVCVGADRLAQ